MPSHSSSRRRPSAPLVISLLALFISLGGVGWAATHLPRNSVGTTQLQDQSVTDLKLATGAVGRNTIQDGAVSAGKVRPAAIGRAEIDSAEVQERVGHTCMGHGAIVAILADGEVTCSK